jgi:hypothetical protein
MTAVTDLSTSADWFGVFTVNNVDFMYYASANAATPVSLIKSVTSIGARSFFVNGDAAAATVFKTKYDHKVITVGNDGRISISSNVKAIGYGAADQPTAVLFTSDKPKTDRTGKGYSIVKSAVAGVLDKLYLDTLIAAPGNYFVSKVSSQGGTVTMIESSKYKGKMIEVKEDGAVHIVELQDKSVIIVPAANNALNAGAVGMNQYGVVTSQQSGANTSHQLIRNPGTGGVPAPAGRYYIQSSDIPQLNNAIVHVLSNGGINIESEGTSGTIARLEENITPLVAEKIPIYSTNEKYQNSNHHINNVIARAHSQFNHSRQLFDKGLIAHLVDNHVVLRDQLHTATSSLQHAILGQAGAVGNSFNLAYANLHDSTMVATTSLLASNAAYESARNDYEAVMDDLDIMFTGLQKIQSDTLTNASGINAFRRNAIFNANALNTSVSVENDPLQHDVAGYITPQIDSFLTQILLTQYNNKNNLIQSLIDQVQTTVSFQVSPSADATPKSLQYANLSHQQKILFDYVAKLVDLWYNSATVGAVGVEGGQNSWGTPATENVAGTKLYSIVAGDNLAASLLQWGKAHILDYFKIGATTVYDQFLTNVNAIATYGNIRISIGAYEDARANVATTSDQANVSANLTYINAVKHNVTAITAANAMTLDTATTAPAAPLANGTLHFDNADQTQATKLYVSLKDGQATPVDISFAGYADTIVLNNSITFTITSVTKNANSYILGIMHVAGTGTPNSVANPVTFVTYQTVSNYTIAKLHTMNTYVYNEYHLSNNYTHYDGSSNTSIKAALVKANTELQIKKNALVEKMNALNTSLTDVVQKVNALNSSEDVLMAHLQSMTASGNILALNGANMLQRELALLGLSLQNQVASVNDLPSYENTWFNDRIAAFWANNAPTPAIALNAYNTAHTQFVTARLARQAAAIALYVANSPPAQSINSPVTVQFINDQAQKISQAIPMFLENSTKEDVSRIISSVISSYVLGRKLASENLSDAIAAAIAKYKDFKQKEAAVDLSSANADYGKASYQRYIALIDLAISRGYHAGLAGSDSLNTNATNHFQTLMQQWNAASNTHKPQVYLEIKQLMFNLIYQTDTTNTYQGATVPLKNASSAIISWFGDNQNGFLSKVIADGLTFANQTLNKDNGGILYANYSLPQNTSVKITVNGQTIVYTVGSANNVIIGTRDLPLVNTTTTATGPSNTVVNVAGFKTSLLTATSDTSGVANAFNVTAARNAALAISSVNYDVTHIGYSSLPSSQPNLANLGFTPINLNFTATLVQGKVRYQFLSDAKWHHGYQQSSTLANSWKKLSPNQDIVVFYPGTDNILTIPANFDSTPESITALCDDASFVMILEPVAGSTTAQSISIYRYDVWGVNSGALIAVGTLTQNVNQAPTVTLHNVAGAFQQIANNPAGSNGVGMVGDLVISNKLKTIGIRAFSNLNLIRSLTFENGGAVNIGSNAFESCNAFSAINLGSSVKSIGASAFRNCIGAVSLALPPLVSSTFTYSIDHWAFIGCNNIANDVQLLSNLAQINVQAFAGCTKLKCSSLSANLPASVKKIGLGAFFNCKGLIGSLNFNNVNQSGKFISSISVLGSAAFMGCSGLNGDLSLPDNSEYLNVLPYTFASMNAPVLSIAAVQLVQPVADAAPMALTGTIDFALNKVTAIERSAFHRCSSLSTLNLSNVISYVGIQSFLGCSGLKQVLLVPAFVKSIGNEAFKGCAGLTGLNIASTMVSQAASEAWLSLGNSSFQDCTSLVSSSSLNGLVIPNSVGFIGDSVFQGCTSLENVSVGSGLSKANSFGSLVFSGCTKLARITIAFSFFARDVAGQSVVKGTQLPTYNASFTGCTALGVPSDTPIGTIQILSGAVDWTPGRAAFFNNLTIVINNKNITFYLKEFNQLANINVVDPSTEPMQQEAIPPTDAQATVHIKASDMRKVFLTSTDSFVGQNADGHAVDHGQLFFVRPEYFPKYLNVSNAHVVQGGIESYNAAIYEQLVKDDVMRYYAMSLFNSADWVTLFANDTEMLENMVASSGLMPVVPDGNYDENEKKNLYNTGVLYNIMKELDKVAYIKTSAVVDPNDKRVQSTNYPFTGTKWWGLPDTVLAEQGNIGKKLFALINRNDPNRISSMVLNGATPSELPFLPGDQFIFIFTLNENKVALTPGLPPVVVKKRTYLIKMILTDDFVSGDVSFAGHFNALYTPSPRNLNVLPVSGAYAADYMYSNYDLHLAIKPSVLTQTSNSVYSRVTQNAYEPIPMPMSLLPFTGWYYSYPYNSQTVRLNFTPQGMSLTNKTLFSDLRYLSAYVYFPENWNTVSVLPAPDNFPQWVLTFTNDNVPIVLKYRAGYLTNAGAETVNFLGQTVPFDYTNTHVQLICPFELPEASQNVLRGKDATGADGTVNTISGSNIYRQRSTLDLVSGLRKTSSTVGPFTYPPIARGYQGINMPPLSVTDANLAAVKDVNQGYRLESIHLEINMANNNGFVPSVVLKSVEVVAKNYEAYYLAPLDPN